MNSLIASATKATSIDSPLPFSVISCLSEQHILNVAISKPLLICVLSGQKELGDEKAIFRPGEFLFLSNTPKVDMRNISNQGSSYFALLIEFEYADFDVFDIRSEQKPCDYFSGFLSPLLADTLQQLVDWAPNVPKVLWENRRKELLSLIYHMGFKQVSSIIEPPSLTYRIEKLIGENLQSDFRAQDVASHLAMSESNVRRKLSSEKTSFQLIKDRVKLGVGLHLVQTTTTSISLIAEQCGYHSQSRFTDKFKTQFGLTPTELRKTQVSS